MDNSSLMMMIIVLSFAGYLIAIVAVLALGTNRKKTAETPALAPKPTVDSIGKTGQHNSFCEGHIICPTTKKEECCKIVHDKIEKVSAQKNLIPNEVQCFACGKNHKVQAT